MRGLRTFINSAKAGRGPNQPRASRPNLAATVSVLRGRYQPRASRPNLAATVSVLRDFLSSLLLAAVAAFGQAPDYFPLEVGNVWIYGSAPRPAGRGEQLTTVEVTRAGNFNGVTYYLLSEYRAGQFCRSIWAIPGGIFWTGRRAILLTSRY